MFTRIFHWRSAACTVTVITEVQKGLLDQACTAAKWNRNIYSLEVLVERHSQVNQITRHGTVTHAAMTELKQRYKCKCGI